MRNVPELRFVGFDGEWEEKKLGDSFTVTMGQSPNSENYTVDSDFLPLIGGNTDIKQGKINPSIFTTQETKKSYPGNIIMTVRAPVGDLAMNSSEVVIGRGVCSIDGNNYLYHNLEKKKYENYWRRFISGSTFESINSSDIKSVLISTPKNSEQEKIGDLFKKIDDLIEIQEGKVSKMEDFKKSMLQKMFPQKDELVPEFRFDGFEGEWKENRLSEIGETYTSLSGKTAEDFGHGEASYVTYMNVYKNPIADVNDLGNIEIDNKQNEVFNGDFFFTTSSETPEEVGLSSAWIYDKSNVYLNSFCFGFRPIINIDTSFFAYFFRSEIFRRKVVMLAQGSTRFNISKKYMMDILVGYPSLEEQEKIGNFFKNLDTQIKKEEKLLDSYKMMKKSLLQKMFV